MSIEVHTQTFQKTEMSPFSEEWNAFFKVFYLL